MLKKFIALALIWNLGACSSFGRGVAEAFLDKDKEIDTRQCEIRGDKFEGIKHYFDKGETVKVMMIHGVGTHHPGYSARIRDNLSKSLNLTVLSRKPKDIILINPADKKTVIGNLRVTRMQDEDRKHNLLFYELTWSDITSSQKSFLSYDMNKESAYKRSAFNNTVKGFLNDTAPDPMIYLTDKNHLILNATKQSTCWMLGKSWSQLKDKQKEVCKVSSYQQIQHLNHENIIFITHSLGSRILIDTIVNIADEVGRDDLKHHKEAQLIINELKNKEFTVFMLANQLPMLQIGRPKPKVNQQISGYCTPKGKHYSGRIFKKLNIVAFSDPNDILSYNIPQSFVDEYIDSRICPSVTNVSINIASEISAFGVGMVNPITAHTGYDNDERVINIISNGTSHIKENKTFSERCRFYELED